MKKVLSIALAATLALSLAACGSGSGSSNTSGESASTSSSDTWPSKTVTIEIAAAAGGGTDNIGRILTNSWQKTTGQAFTVVDDATGNGTVAYEAVRNASPDGYTLLYYHSTMPIQYYQGVYGYDPGSLDNFTPIATVPNGGDADVLVVPADAPYSTVEELVSYCKEHPGELTFGNQNGGFGHLETLLFEARAEIDINFVDAGGQADAIISLLGGNIDACFISSDAAAQYAESGDMKCLAICQEERSPKNVPDVPTMKECGYDVVFPVTFIVLGPAGMDPEVVEQINAVIATTADDSEAVDTLAGMGQSYTHRSVEETQKIWQDHCNVVKEVCGLAGYDISGK